MRAIYIDAILNYTRTLHECKPFVGNNITLSYLSLPSVLNANHKRGMAKRDVQLERDEREWNYR